jgi:hypothetical protein
MTAEQKEQLFEAWLKEGSPNPMEVLQLLYCKGTMPNWTGRGVATIQLMGGGTIEVAAIVVEGMAQAGMIERRSKSWVGSRYFEWQLSDIGLGMLGHPSRAESMRVEVLGVDNRVKGRRR